MEFDAVAKKIVGDSICTAICIDNAFEEPYTHVDHPSDPSFKLPKELYESFKKQNCVLDFYKYVDLETWETNQDYILKNKDLLILDWELIDGDPKYKDALEILLKTVNSDSLAFVYIYTHEMNLDSVALNISSYFSHNSLKELKSKYETFGDNLEDLPEVDDANIFLQRIKDKCKEIVVNPNKARDIRKEISESFAKYLDSENIGIFCDKFYTLGKQIFECENENDFLIFLGRFLNNGLFRDGVTLNIDIYPIEGEKYTYIINNTLVKISTKKLTSTEMAGGEVVSPDEVYSEFSKTICRRPRNFLALLGLEMKNLYRDSSSVIGKDINEIDELAFFHHQESLETDEEGEFYTFLKNIWKDEVSYFILDQTPLLFLGMDDYKIKNKINQNIEDFRRNSKVFIENLAKLNYYYSMLRPTESKHRKIIFGDVFSIVSDDEESYLLCITPHCDCIQPKKINNCLYFVSGKKIRAKSGLKRGDSGFISYVKIDKDINCIDWKTSPFTLFISLEENDITNSIKSELSGKKICLKYLGSQKENYTQRIANESFSWASRVGIDFAKIEEEEGNGNEK